jgi:virulence-associated protein VagC
MKTAVVIETTNGQAVQIPDEFRFQTDRVGVRRQGDAVVLEPLKPATWPDGFFDAIYIDDPAFARADQGVMPTVPTLD